MVATARFFYNPDFFFSLGIGLDHGLSFDNLRVEYFAKSFWCFISDLIILVNANDIIGSQIKKNLSYFLRVACINKDNLWKALKLFKLIINSLGSYEIYDSNFTF